MVYYIRYIQIAKEATIIDNKNNQPPRRPIQRPATQQGAKPAQPQKAQNGTSKQAAKKSKGKITGKAITFAILRFIASCVCIGVIGVSVVAVLVSLYVVDATSDDGDLLNLDNIKLSYTTIIKVRDANGQWVEDRRLVGEENREWVNLDVISDNLENAFIAIEDKNFYNHMGFSVKRTTLAAINEVFEKLTGSYLTGTMQGASTINQQLIKNITNDDKQDYGRKIREIFRAISLDNKYSKEIILEAYLNTIRLTGNVAGVQAGAHNYYNKRLGVDELTIAECASIAAITKDPNEYNPATNPEKHLKRRNNVIWEMRKQKLITQAEYEQALLEPLRLAEVKTAASTGFNTYAQDAVIDDVIEDFMAKYGWTREEANREFYNGGYTVYGAYDPVVQKTLEEAMNNREVIPEFKVTVPKRDNKNQNMVDAEGKVITHEITTQSAMVTLNYNGEVIANVGGVGAKEGDRTLNRAMDVPRAVGSTMKGVTVYPLAIEQGWVNWSRTILDDFYELIPDKNGNLAQEWPQNYEETYTKRYLTIEEAVRRSVNTVAVRVGTDFVTVRTMYDFAKETLQINSLVPGDMAKAPMCLGALEYGMTPLELASAYMMYGNGGEFVTPHTYLAVENSRGEVVLEPDVVRVQAISEDTAYIMNRLLSNVLGAGGTAPGIRTKTTDGVGKTGTTNEVKDVWFAGVTPNYVSAGWLGYDTNDAMTKYNANRIKHPIAVTWRNVMDIVQEGTENKNFKVSENVEKRAYCKESGANPGAACPDVAQGYYRKGEEIGSCTVAGHY